MNNLRSKICSISSYGIILKKYRGPFYLKIVPPSSGCLKLKKQKIQKLSLNLKILKFITRTMTMFFLNILFEKYGTS